MKGLSSESFWPHSRRPGTFPAPAWRRFFGSGGKTGLIRALAAELASRDQRVLVSTTTKIYPPQASQGDLLLGEAIDIPRLQGALKPGTPLTLAGRRLPNGKLQGFGPGEFAALAGERDLWLLVEADGSARRPLKAWAPWEPVVPPGCGLVAMLLGAGGMGRPLDGQYVHRPELFAAQSGLEPGDVVTPKALARVVLHPEGPLSRLPEAPRPILVITGRQAAGPGVLADLAERLAPGFSRVLVAGPGFKDLAKPAS